MSRPVFWLVTPRGIRAVPNDTHQTYSTLAAARAVRHAYTPAKPRHRYDAGAVALYRLYIYQGFDAAHASRAYAAALADPRGWAWRCADALEWSKGSAAIIDIAARRVARSAAAYLNARAVEFGDTVTASIGWKNRREDFTPDALTIVGYRPETIQVEAPGRSPRTRDW